MADHLLLHRIQPGELSQQHASSQRIRDVLTGGCGDVLALVLGQGSRAAEALGGLEAMPLLLAQAKGLSQFGLSGQPTETDLEFTPHTPQPILQFLVTTRQSHRSCLIPEVMQDCATDVGASKGREGSALGLVKQLRGPEQAHQPHLLEILSGFRAAMGVVPGDRPDQMAVLLQALVALLEPRG
jgi:hypothetical protein